MDYFKRGFALIFLIYFGCHLHILGDEIHDAAGQGKLHLVKSLLEKNPALVNARDKNKSTPLHHAAWEGHLEVVRSLIASGGDISARNNYGWTSLHSASYRGQVEVGELLIDKGIPVDAPDIYGWTPLCRAIQGNQLAMVQFLAKRGADLNYQDGDGDTPLFLAVLKGNEEIMEYLLGKGVQRILSRGEGETLLHVAAASGFLYGVKRLIKLGEKINARKKYNLTPLHLAAAFGKKEVVQYLCENGAEVNAVSKETGTPLVLALSTKQQSVAKLLLSKGAKRDLWRFPEFKGEYLGQKKPEMNPQPFAPGILTNLFRPHSNITISPDGKEIYWSASGTYGMGEKIWFTRQENGVWTAPSVASFSNKYTSGGPSISPDGKKLFFQSRRPIEPGGEPVRDANIWVMARKATGWGDPRLVSISHSKYSEVFPSVSIKGNLFFQADYPDKSHGARDIYKSVFVKGVYSSPVNLGPAINTSYSEACPWIAPDESYLIFQSLRPGGQVEGNQLYISFRDKDDKWTPAKNMGRKINEGMTSCGYVSPDGKYLFFLRRKDGAHEYWWVSAKIMDHLKPEKLK